MRANRLRIRLGLIPSVSGLRPGSHDVGVRSRWYPIVTFLQVGIDLTNAAGVPHRHGHRYGEEEQVDAWAAVIAPDGWTQKRTEQLRELICDTQ